MISTLELFEEFFKDVKESKSIDEIYKAYGGAYIYVPSYKSTTRNMDIFNEYKEGVTLRKLSVKYSITQNRLRVIIKELEESN
ncbi:hypothetical protein KKC13_00845 [bacterium]|nr:hypothetical protein [bacterium]MBU1958942.1 hypothetical protein [bacterium]